MLKGSLGSQTLLWVEGKETFKERKEIFIVLGPRQVEIFKEGVILNSLDVKLISQSAFSWIYF